MANTDRPCSRCHLNKRAYATGPYCKPCERDRKWEFRLLKGKAARSLNERLGAKAKNRAQRAVADAHPEELALAIAAERQRLGLQ